MTRDTGGKDTFLRLVSSTLQSATCCSVEHPDSAPNPHLCKSVPAFLRMWMPKDSFPPASSVMWPSPYYNMWTHVPTLHTAIAALVGQGGRGVTTGGPRPHDAYARSHDGRVERAAARPPPEPHRHRDGRPRNRQRGLARLSAPAASGSADPAGDAPTPTHTGRAGRRHVGAGRRRRPGTPARFGPTPAIGPPDLRDRRGDTGVRANGAGCTPRVFHVGPDGSGWRLPGSARPPDNIHVTGRAACAPSPT